MNLLVNQTIRWTEPVFNGSFPKSQFVGERTSKGIIVKDSYGYRRGQHSFTMCILESTGTDPLPVGSTCRRLGRNLYKTAEILEQPSNLEQLQADKEKRAKEAKERKYFAWLQEAEFESKPWKTEKIPFWFIQENMNSIQQNFPVCCAKLKI